MAGGGQCEGVFSRHLFEIVFHQYKTSYQSKTASPKLKKKIHQKSQQVQKSNSSKIPKITAATKQL